MAYLSTHTLQQQLTSRGIAAFSSIDDISWLKLPYRLESMLMMVCVKGQISATIDLKQRSMRQNTIMVLRPGHIINHIVTTPDFEGIFFLAGIDKLASLVPMMSGMMPFAIYYAAKPIININANEISALQMLYTMFQTKMADNSDQPYHEHIISALVELIFYQTLAIYAGHITTPINKPSRPQRLLASFMELVEANFRKERMVMFYAKELNVSPKHLSAVIKEISGRSPAEWINNTVILEAKLMLRNSNMTIQQIAESLSFANQSFFGKYFKHHTGLSPREFRSNPLLV